MKKFIFILVIISNYCTKFYGQYFPVFSQYVVNGLVVNPGYTGSREVLSINFMYRNQMTGIKGAPVYQTFSAHAPLKNPNLGIGFLFFNEKTGPSHNTHAFATYAYRIQMGESKLSLGLQTGVIYREFNWNQVYLNDIDDEAFNANADSYILPNIGAGVYYSNKKLFVGLSIPYFLSVKESGSREKFSIYHEFKNYNFLFTAGYLLYLSNDFKLKPSTLIKYYLEDDEQIDINLTAIMLNNTLSVGVAYRLQEAVAGMCEVQLNPQFRLSYTFEYAGKNSGYFNYTSHEIGLRYEFSYKLKAFNPRYF